MHYPLPFAQPPRGSFHDLTIGDPQNNITFRELKWLSVTQRWLLDIYKGPPHPMPLLDLLSAGRICLACTNTHRLNREIQEEIPERRCGQEGKCAWGWKLLHRERPGLCVPEK